ncbi:MAG TPA: ATP-binding protein [Ruminococcus flavefaciens]|nr:ATP-binding protein [Ruminococcus flavefaciens]
MTFLKTKKKAASPEKKKAARDIDKERELAEQKDKKTRKVNKARIVKKTTIHTMPYECFVSDYVMLLKTNVRVGKEYANIYSKTYKVPDCNYSSLTEDEQLEKMQIFIDCLNGMDSNVSLQISIINSHINSEEFEDRMLLKDGEYPEMRKEINNILTEKVMRGRNGLQCRKFITVTVLAVDYETASTRFYNIEAHLVNCMERLGTKVVPVNANAHVRLIADILRDPNDVIREITKKEFARQEEKMLCCPDYFEFKKDYFMFNDKYARCLYFRRLPPSIIDTLYKEIVELNLEMVIAENIEFVDTDDALTMVKRKITDMKEEEIKKTRKAAEAARGAFVDPIEGSQLAIDKAHAQEFLEDLQQRNQKMTLCQFIVILISNSYEEMLKNTEAFEIVMRKYQIDAISAPYRQEQAFASALPVGNSMSYDKDKNLQVRRTLSSESTAAFMPFNAKELRRKGGMWYGHNQMSRSTIMFDRRKLHNPNGFIFGVPGSGKSVTAKLEIIYSVLSTNDEILILDPEREYVALCEMLGGEVINISANSATHINPLDLTENPDKDDKEYDPIKAKYDFMLSFFSAILGNSDINPVQKTIIDTVMHKMYDKYKGKNPTLKEYYEILEQYENEVEDEIKSETSYLRQTLHLYVFGSMSVFSHESNVNINKRIVVYDIKDLGKNLQTLGMMITLENIWDRVAHNRSKGIGTRIYIDEMYLLFKSEQSANFFYELYKRARKWGGIPTGITQNVDDLLRSELARTMLSNTEFVIMLSQNATDREQLSDLLKISKDTMKYVTNSRSGSGLIFAGDYGCIPFEHIYPKDTIIYKYVTTRFGENLKEKVDTSVNLENTDKKG